MLGMYSCLPNRMGKVPFYLFLYYKNNKIQLESIINILHINKLLSIYRLSRFKHA